MKKNILNLFLFCFIFTQTKPTVYEFMKESDRIYEECIFDVMKKHECTKCCPSHYVITDCLEECCSECLDTIEDGIQECRQKRTDFLNKSIEDACLDPWKSCPSCKMEF